MYQYEDTLETLHWHLTRLQPLLRDNAVQIGCRLQSRGHCILNKLHKCPAICYLPPSLPPCLCKYPDAEVLVYAVSFFSSIGSPFIMQFIVSHTVSFFHSFKCVLTKTFQSLQAMLNPESLAVHHVKVWKTAEGRTYSFFKDEIDFH